LIDWLIDLLVKEQQKDLGAAPLDWHCAT